MDGEEFLRRMRSRDPSAWDELMPSLRKIALGACRDLRVFDQSRDDIVQDVALKVFTHWQHFQGGSKLNTWIYAIARNRCLDDIRRIRIRNEFSSEATSEDEGSGDSILDRIIDDSQSNMEQRLCVQQVLAELDTEPPARKGSMRKIDMLRWWVQNHPTSEEFAQFLKTSVAAAKERKSYVLKHLRELCHKFCGHQECSLSEAS